MKIKSMFVYGLLFFVIITENAKSEVPKVFEWAQSNFINIESVKYTLIKELNDSGLVWTTKTVSEWQLYHRIDYKNFDKDGVLITSYAEALTQDYLQIFYVEDRFLRLYKPEIKPANVLKWQPYLFSCFDFLYDMDSDLKHLHLYKAKVLLAQVSEVLEEKVIVTKRQYQNKGEVSSIDLPQETLKFFSKKVFYRVFYDSKTGELFGWELRLSDNPIKLLQEFVIIKAEYYKDRNSKIPPIWYPVLVKHYYYGWDEENLYDKPTHFLKYTTTLAQFNELEETDAMIDPAEAKVIRDEMNGKNIFLSP